MDIQNQCEELQADQPELTTKQLEMEICRLNAQLWKRRRMDIAEHKERSIAQIGRCFKNNYGQYVIVAEAVGLPGPVQSEMSGPVRSPVPETVRSEAPETVQKTLDFP